jgi:Ca2+-transporting ATPase
MVVNYYAQELDNIYRDLKTDPNSGLSKQEAQKRLVELGTNEIPRVSKGFIKIYLAPLFNWLIVIYLIGSLVLLLASFFVEDANLNMVYVTLGIVAFNCLIAIFQQMRATKKLNALRELTAPTATIIRDGSKLDISTKEIVVGDLLVLSQGDKIPADSRIIQSANLEVNEASLTGESEPAKKLSEGTPLEKGEISIGSRHNMVFYGTYITTGNGSSIVVATGGDTEIGKISQGLEDAGTSEIPIRKKMNHFGMWLGGIVMAFWLVVLLVLGGITGFDDFAGLTIKSLNSAMDLMPINLPLLVTIVLLTGVLAMARHGVIVRNIASVDSLGRTSVVCSDKTGTLTKNQMCIQYVWADNSIYKVTGSGFDPNGEVILMDDPKNLKTIRTIEKYPNLKLLISSGYLNNNSALVKNQVTIGSKVIDKWEVIGSPTEGAFLVLFQKVMGDYILDEYESVREYPFDSKIKRMTKIYKKEGSFFSFTKGASEVLVPLCTRVIYKGNEENFTEQLKNDTLTYINKFAAQGYRILSLCYKRMDVCPPETEESREVCESGMIYIGFVAIVDPPREGVKESVEECHKAGVDVIMITGDSPTTAKAIAQQISVIQKETETAIEGSQINDIIDTPKFDDVRVFARVSPKNKEEIIKKYQSKKKVVAMTGDGVNDALALNLADAGLAMGITGTDVAKEASDMVISDDSFNSIVKGIHQGRGIFAKIRAVVFFYICINVFEGITQFILAIILNLPYWVDPVSPFYYQWLFLSLTVHMLPGLVLTFDTISDDVMDEHPRDSEEILSRNTAIMMLIFGALLSVSMIIVYSIASSGIYMVWPENTAYGLYTDGARYAWYDILHAYKPYEQYTELQLLQYSKALTMLMVVLFICETFLVLQIRRPNKSLIQTLKGLREDSNPLMYLFLGICWAGLIALMYIPAAQLALAGKSGTSLNFMFMTLNGVDWLVCLGISMICVIAFDVIKGIAKQRGISF